VKLGEICNNHDGERIPLSKEVRTKRKGEYRYYGATKIIDYIDEYIYDGKYLLIGEDGANLVSKSRELAFIVTGKFWVNNHAHVLSAKEGVLLEYVSYFFNSITLEPYVTGSAQPKLTQANLNKIQLPICSIEAQREIISEIERRFSVADKLEQTIDENLKKADLLKQSILKQAFEGKLV
jgi:type I restriction enzyme S subunit